MLKKYLNAEKRQKQLSQIKRVQEREREKEREREVQFGKLGPAL